MGTVHVVSMIPASLSGETNQDSEPNLAVNPENPSDIVATAFTPSPLGGSFAPFYISTNGGNTWSLRNVVPGNGAVGTGDISVGFATSGGILYAGILNGVTGHMQILRTANMSSISPMTVLVDRANEDQPWVVAGSVVVGGASRDHVFVGNNNFSQPVGRTATVDLSQDAGTAPPPAGFAPVQIEQGATVGQDGPPIRLALHTDGTVYAAFQRWTRQDPAFPNVRMDIVITRDDNWGAGAPPFGALVNPATGVAGTLVADNRFIRWNASMGQERLGGDLSVAIDPTDSNDVWVAWCDRVGGATGTDWTLHVRHSTDRGQNWSADVRTITNAKNPSLAVNSNRLLGLAYQMFTGTQWVTQMELTANAWASNVETHVLHRAPATTPARVFWPYLGDYIRLLAVGRMFYGVFSGNNTPDMVNFPSGVTYQRHADWTTHTLFNVDGVTPVTPSIDPFFFHWSDIVPPIGPIIAPGPRARGPILPEPRGPIIREPPKPIVPEPIIPEPPRPIEGQLPTQQPSAGRKRGQKDTRSSKKRKPPSDVEL